MDFESQLRAALAKRDPGTDFTGRVLAAAKERELRNGSGWRTWAAGLAAASLLIGGIGLADLEQYRQRERAAEAHAQLVQALQITSAKLNQIEKKVEGLSR